jgi:hypothetical protein
MKQSSPNFKRSWVLPILLLTAVALVLYLGFYALDFYVSGGPAKGGHPSMAPWTNPVAQYLRFDQEKITDAVSSLAGMVAAVFGIVITVVSIVVQLSADRYTGVARMFLKDRLNLAVMAFYVVFTVYGVWLSVSLRENFVPRAALVSMLIATTGGVVLMAPYFGYVFWFLEPTNIVDRIRRDAMRTVSAGTHEVLPERSDDAQAQALGAMEELTDITSNSISGRDKIIASRAIDALKDFVIEYLKTKKDAQERWFAVGPGIRQHPDFVAMDPESLQDLEQRHTWFEWMVLRQYLGIYNEALGPMRDINYLIAIDTRYIGEAAADAGDQELMTLVLRFTNSFLRSTLNAKDVRTAYNVLNQYRLLVESMLRKGQSRAALAAVKHIIYYGQLSFDMNLPFVTETAAYDVAGIVQCANELGVKEETEMLGDFLELDQPLRSRSQEKALLGVRKAQVKLAAYYLMRGEEDKARRIAQDMRNEPPERLAAIRQQLERVTSKDFWEIIDRGRNFEYMVERQRVKMADFFTWLEAGREEV